MAKALPQLGLCHVLQGQPSSDCGHLRDPMVHSNETLGIGSESHSLLTGFTRCTQGHSAGDGFIQVIEYGLEMGRWQVADSIREHLGPGMLSPLKHQRSDDLCSTSSAPGLSKHHRSLRREDALGGYERQLKRPEDCSDTLEVKRYAPPPHTKKFIGPRL